ncbi:Rv1733c family protein [Kribbella sp. NPDC054772]
MSGGKQRTGELWVLMQARRLGFGPSTLRRRPDRIESLLLWCALIAALLMVPIGAAIGTSVRNSLDASAAQERARLYEVRARTLEGTEPVSSGIPGGVLSLVPVAYVDARGTEHEGLTTVVMGTKANSDVMVWLDTSGLIVTTPRSPADSAALGGTVGTFVVLGSWMLLWGGFRLARIPLDRRRLRDWDTEWRTISARWLRGQK